MTWGIESIGLATTRRAIEMTTLAELRGVDPDKYLIGLGCRRMAVAGPDEEVATLAAAAARRAVASWGGDPETLGLVVVATESSPDASRPLSAWIVDALKLPASIRSYEVKHACVAGLQALLQAGAWYRLEGGGRRALVVAADIARYAPGSPGEPTGGAGAVAFVVGQPRMARIHPTGLSWSRPIRDFWRPITSPYPEVDGPVSLAAYLEGARTLFARWLAAGGRPERVAAFLWHVPFPKMVRKAWSRVAELFELDAEAAERAFLERIEPHLAWNREVGNAYTASLPLAIAHALAHREPKDRLLAYGYGSGAAAELVELEVSHERDTTWAMTWSRELAARERLDGDAYLALRSSERPLAYPAHVPEVLPEELTASAR